MTPIAMILAAGKGTRLQPYTESTPKALLEFRGKPMLYHIISKLKSYSYDRVVINIHHHADQIVDYVRSNNDFGMKISFSDERNQLMDTGGGILKARRLLEGHGPFLVHNVDIFSDIDLDALCEYHMEHQPLATLAVKKRETSRNLLVDSNNNLCGWRDNISGESVIVQERERLNDVAFSGIHMIDPEIFGLLHNENPFSIIKAYLELAGNHPILTYDHSDGQWIDMSHKDHFPGKI
jgi:NDP-sugar pyrophosphorylase family protein